VIITDPTRLKMIPYFAICEILSAPLLIAMAFGGVAMGSINAKLALIVATIITSVGSTSML
jgi:hypothetical protein